MAHSAYVSEVARYSVELIFSCFCCFFSFYVMFVVSDCSVVVFANTAWRQLHFSVVPSVRLLDVMAGVEQ